MAVRVVLAELLSQCLLWWEARLMVKGTLIAESLQIGVELRVAGLRLTRLSRRDFSTSVTAAQPAVWTIVEFEADDDVADDFGRSLAQSLLADGGWYADFGAGHDHVVVFAGRIFRYRRGDHAGRAEAVAYGETVGVPGHQLDTPD
jgi:hypothetical protein